MSLPVIPSVLRPGGPLPHPIRVAHRGAAATCPHNTRLAYETALSQGVDLLETDVHRCASGELVLCHDDVARGVTTGALEIANSTLAQLRELDLGQGERILTLADLFSIARDRCGLMLDLKAFGFEEQLIQEIRSSGFPADALILSGAPLSSRQRLRSLAPEYAVSLSLGRYPQGAPSPAFFDEIDTPAVTWQHPMLTRDAIGELRRRGKTIYAWTVDQEDRMLELLRDGVDGIITNRPAALNAVLETRNSWHTENTG